MDESKRKGKIDKLNKKLDEDFVDSVRASSSEALKDMVVSLSQEMEKTQNDKKVDPTLEKLKEDLKALNGGYNDIIKEKKKRISLVLLTLEERGKI